MLETNISGADHKAKLLTGLRKEISSRWPEVLRAASDCQKLVFCNSCGKAMGPKKYLDFISQRVKSVGTLSANAMVCEDCSRKKSARFSVDTMPV